MGNYNLFIGSHERVMGAKVYVKQGNDFINGVVTHYTFKTRQYSIRLPSGKSIITDKIYTYDSMSSAVHVDASTKALPAAQASSFNTMLAKFPKVGRVIDKGNSGGFVVLSLDPKHIRGLKADALLLIRKPNDFSNAYLVVKMGRLQETIEGANCIKGNKHAYATHLGTWFGSYSSIVAEQKTAEPVSNVFINHDVYLKSFRQPATKYLQTVKNSMLRNGFKTIETAGFIGADVYWITGEMRSQLWDKRRDLAIGVV